MIFTYRKKGRVYEYSGFHKKLGSFLEKRGIGYIDLYEDYNGKEDIWVDRICHPNEKGFKIAVDKILLLLKEKSII